MSGARRVGSVLAIGGLLFAAAACSSSSETSTGDSSTTRATSAPATSAPGTSAPGTTVGGVTDGEGTDGTDVAPVTTAPTTTAEPITTTTAGDGTAPSVPIVDPASVEAFCALDKQLDSLSDAQMKLDDLNDTEALRLAFAKFLTDNAAVIDQYVAAAPPEIEASVDESMAQLRAAVADPAAFEATMSGNTAASDRVSDFIDANCPSSAG